MTFRISLRPGRVAALSIGILLAGIVATALVPTTAEALSEPGHVSGQIVGGSAVPITDAPWQVVIIDASARSEYDGYFCGGSLISPQWILTAAHCVTGTAPADIKILLGRATLSKRVNRGVAVDRIIVHPRYSSRTSANDLAVVRLSAPVTLSLSLQPIALPSVMAAAETSALISGWGNTHWEDSNFSYTPHYPAQLQAASLFVKSDAFCRGDVGPGFLRASMLCATTANYMQDTCQGDSGGPLATLEGATWVLSGITSWGDGCANASAGVYTRVVSYLTWIDAKVPLGVG